MPEIGSSYKPGSKRFYCPKCGGAYEGYNHWSVGWVVESHARTGRSGSLYDRICPGGQVDLVKDRAP